MFARASALGLLGLVTACSGAPTKSVPNASHKLSEATKQGGRKASAMWVAHPSPYPRPSSASRLADGRCLLIEDSGQRWLSSPFAAAAEDTPSEPSQSMEDYDSEREAYGASNLIPIDVPRSCAGPAVAAMDHPGESLIAMVRGKTTFGFVGESGTVYLSESPLGKFVRRTYPKERMLSVRSAGRLALGISETGAVYRWDEEKGYERVPLEDAHAIDVAISSRGDALVLAVPETLFTSTDGGAKFERRDAPKIGAMSIEKPASKPFLIKGWAGTLSWDPHQPTVFSKTNEEEGAEPQLANVFLTVGNWPAADSVYSGEGCFDGDNFYQLTTTSEGTFLYGGQFGRALTRKPLPVDTGVAGDGHTWLAVRQPHIVLVTVSWEDDGIKTTAHISHDRGQTFAEHMPLETNGGSQLGVAISSEGTVLINGVCAPSSAETSDASSANTTSYDPSECVPGVLRVPRNGLAMVPKGASMAGLAAAMEFSKDGQFAYLLGESDAEDGLVLFVSNDAGASFKQRPLALNGEAKTTFFALDGVRITVSESGTVGMALTAKGEKQGPHYVTTDAEGRNLRANEVPDGPNVLAGYGEHVLAIPTAAGTRATRKPIWESENGGATWTEFPSPEILARISRYRSDLVCDAAGCIIGDAISRVGWGEKPDVREPFEIKPPPEVRDEPQPSIYCAPKENAVWSLIPNVPESYSVPDEHNAGRGASAWMLPTHDPTTGAMGVVAATFPSGDGTGGTIVRKQILGPTPKGSVWATSTRPQIEGVAFARAKISDTPNIAPLSWLRKPIKNLEIGWENEEEGTTGRAVIPNAGKFDPSTVLDYGNGTFGLALVMTSISPKGTFVRATWGKQTSYFVDTSGKVKTFSTPSAAVPGRDDAPLEATDVINVDGAFVPNRPAGGSRPYDPEVLLLMQPPKAGSPPETLWNLWAMTLAPGDDSRDFRYTLRDWTYDGGYLTRWTIHVVPKAGYATGWLERVLGDGTLSTPRKIGVPYNLSTVPRPCTPNERKSEPRVKVPLMYRGQRTFPGTSHPVFVATDKFPKSGNTPGSKDPTRMMPTGYVVRGPPSATCLDILAAEPNSSETSVLIVGDLTQGWYFRMAAADPSKRDRGKVVDAAEPAARSMETLPLTCRIGAAP